MCVCVCLRVNFIILAVREEAARQALCRAVGLGGEAGVPGSLPILPLPLLCRPPGSPLRAPAPPTSLPSLLQSASFSHSGIQAGAGAPGQIQLCVVLGSQGPFLCLSVFISVEMNGDHYLVALL